MLPSTKDCGCVPTEAWFFGSSKIWKGRREDQSLPAWYQWSEQHSHQLKKRKFLLSGSLLALFMVMNICKI